MSDSNHWMLELGLGHDAHRFFFDWGSGPDREAIPHLKWRVAIADTSGKFPDTTDDGILYLDRRRPISLDGDSQLTSPPKTSVYGSNTKDIEDLPK